MHINLSGSSKNAGLCDMFICLICDVDDQWLKRKVMDEGSVFEKTQAIDLRAKPQGPKVCLNFFSSDILWTHFV